MQMRKDFVRIMDCIQDTESFSTKYFQNIILHLVAQSIYFRSNMNSQNSDPLHGMTLEKILIYLVETKGWDYMADQVKINCFSFDPTIKSSLAFLRKTPWARSKVERLYVYLKNKEKK